MSKAIYAIVNGNVFRLNQDTSETSNAMLLSSKTYATAMVDTALKTIREKVRISTMETANIKTNKEMFHLIEKELKEKKVTSIPEISGTDFQLYLDYTIMNGDTEVAHNITISPIDVVDAAIILGVASNNELVYRRAKVLSNEVEISFTNLDPAGELPIGIMKTCDTDLNYRFVINGLAIYMNTNGVSTAKKGCAGYSKQCKSCNINRVCGRYNIHNSIYNTPYNVCCSGCGGSTTTTVPATLSDYTEIFSTSASGIIIQEVDMGFVPRKFIVDLELILANIVVAYDDTSIEEVLIKNASGESQDDPSIEPGEDEPGHVDPPHHPGHHHHHHHDDDIHVVPIDNIHPQADGDTTPDAEGWYDYYTKCRSTDPGALLVIENNYPESVIDYKRMIKKEDVIKDIPDIMVGEYVKYVRTQVTDETPQPDPQTDDSSDDQTDNQSNSASQSAQSSGDDDDDFMMIDVNDLGV